MPQAFQILKVDKLEKHFSIEIPFNLEHHEYSKRIY